MIWPRPPGNRTATPRPTSTSNATTAPSRSQSTSRRTRHASSSGVSSRDAAASVSPAVSVVNQKTWIFEMLLSESRSYRTAGAEYFVGGTAASPVSHGSTAATASPGAIGWRRARVKREVPASYELPATSMLFGHLYRTPVSVTATVTDA
ncbi:MAG: hypothetical protein EBR82_59935, partial [Caulobacteraceae bacterium]|nr:hypothetical protein [Caulobacteraceae bacterium]